MIQASQIVKKDLYIIFNPYIRQKRRSIELYGHRYKYFILNEKMFQNINQINVSSEKKLHLIILITKIQIDLISEFMVFFFFRNSHTTT